jgi:hypothetical protein
MRGRARAGGPENRIRRTSALMIPQPVRTRAGPERRHWHVIRPGFGAQDRPVLWGVVLILRLRWGYIVLRFGKAFTVP